MALTAIDSTRSTQLPTPHASQPVAPNIEQDNPAIGQEDLSRQKQSHTDGSLRGDVDRCIPVESVQRTEDDVALSSKISSSLPCLRFKLSS